MQFHPSDTQDICIKNSFLLGDINMTTGFSFLPFTYTLCSTFIAGVTQWSLFIHDISSFCNKNPMFLETPQF